MQTKYDELARLAEASIKIDTSPWPSKNDFIELFGQWDAAFMEAANPATIKAMHADMVAMVSELTRCRTMLLILQEELDQDDIERWNSLQLRIEQIDAALARVKGEKT